MLVEDDLDGHGCERMEGNQIRSPFLDQIEFEMLNLTDLGQSMQTRY